MKVFFKLVLVLFFAWTTTQSDAESRAEERAEDDSWADVELPPSSRFRSSPYRWDYECDRREFLKEQTQLYSDFHAAIEHELRPINKSDCDRIDFPAKLNPLSGGDLTSYYLAEVANVKWLEQRQIVSGPEVVSPISNPVLGRSRYFPVHRERRSTSTYSSVVREGTGFPFSRWLLFEPDMFSCLRPGSRVRTEWRIVQLHVVRLNSWAPKYSLAVRHIDFDQNDGVESRSGMSALCAFERRAIRELESNFDSDVVVDEHDDEIQIVGAVRRYEIPFTNLEGPPPPGDDLYAVVSYCLKRVE